MTWRTDFTGATHEEIAAEVGINVKSPIHIISSIIIQYYKDGYGRKDIDAHN